MRLCRQGQSRRVGEIVAAAEHHADGEEQRRQNDRWTPGVATAKEHVAKRQGEQAGKCKQHDRVGMAGKREEHLVAHVQHARGFGVNRQDCVARHRGGIDGKRRGRQQREQKCDERLLGGVALKPDDAAASRAAVVERSESFTVQRAFLETCKKGTGLFWQVLSGETLRFCHRCPANHHKGACPLCGG